MDLIRGMFFGVLAVLGASMILLAYSEFVFLNEGPVQSLISATDGAMLADAAAAYVMFYLPAGLVLVALEPLMTTWTRTLLAGAFVGWAIEAAIVPVAYENIPLSYFWTSISWHAMIDVAFGYVAYRLLLRRSLIGTIIATLALGVFWGVWATWLWGEIKLTLDQFMLLATVVCGLITVGYVLSDLSLGRVRGRVRWWIVAAAVVNGALWAINAIPYLFGAGGLLALALLTGWALMRAPEGQGPLIRGPMPVWRYAFPAIACVIATMTYATVLESGPVMELETLVAAVLMPGVILFPIALIVGLFRIQRRKKAAAD